MDTTNTDSLGALVAAVNALVGQEPIQFGIGPACVLTASPLKIMWRGADGVPREVEGDPTLADALTAFLNEGITGLTPETRRAMARLLDTGRAALAVELDELGAKAVVVVADGQPPVWLFTATFPTAMH